MPFFGKKRYLDNVLPDAMGVSKPFYFFLMPSFWTGANDACCGSGGRRQKAAQEWEATDSDVVAEEAALKANFANGVRHADGKLFIEVLNGRAGGPSFTRRPPLFVVPLPCLFQVRGRVRSFPFLGRPTPRRL